MKDDLKVKICNDALAVGGPGAENQVKRHHWVPTRGAEILDRDLLLNLFCPRQGGTGEAPI